MWLAAIVLQVALQPVAANTEWMIAAGVAHSVNLFESTGGRHYAVQNVSFGKELTGDLKAGFIRGRFTWAVEAMPVFYQFKPSHLYGVGFAPVVWRWNFPPHPRWSAFAELSMGGLVTSDAIPEGTERVNFTAHWGGGVRLRTGASQSIVLGYRFQHISNGNQLSSNPGVNSHVVILGMSFQRR